MSDHYEDFATWEADGFTFTLAAAWCSVPIEGNVMASGDDTYDAECEAHVAAELSAGNMFAWCELRCTADRGGFTGIDYLGCVQVDNSKDALEAFGDDMAAEARADWERNVADARARLALIDAE